MLFTKMHGCGNDYIYIDGTKEKIPDHKKAELARYLSDRHFGVGGDGVIFILPSGEADFEMEMYNADGSRAEMCGNGIRCVAKYVYDKKLTGKTDLSIISAGRIKTLSLTVADSQVTKVRVNMGSPVLEAVKIPVVSPNKIVIDDPILVNGREYRISCVSMGNPHAVVITEGVAEMNLAAIGPLFENHEKFPHRINTEFVEIIDKNNIFMRVWERGSGETLACGTGCCAAAVACILNGLTFDLVTVKLLGGELAVQWDRTADIVYMTGPAVTVFEGEICNPVI